jgi:hypothetical protein
VTCAQATRPWPHNAAGKIEFTGRLPWPDSARTEAQRQLLVRRWYRRTLTNDKPAVIRQFIQEDGVTYGGIPTASCYRLRIMGDDDERFNLCFKLTLSTGNTGLVYLLTDFECSESVFDAITGASLEEALTLPGTRVQTVLAIFCERLSMATKGW